MTLHVTNGDILADRLKTIGIDGYVLPWREVLHEGTIADYQSVDGVGRHTFNTDRAAIIDYRGWGRAEVVVEEMNQRDAILLDPRWKEVVLWLEHDLFDQLIASQVLTLLWRSGRAAHIDVRLTQPSRHLNYLTDAELLHVGRTPRTFTAETIAPYLEFWIDVTSHRPFPEPQTLVTPLDIARKQWLELQPGSDGLSIFDKRVIELVERRGKVKVDVLFQQINAEDGDCAFWGDLPFNARLSDLARKIPGMCLHDDVVEYAS